MCGICGWLNLNDQLNMQTFVSMNNIARYRGPDDEGYVAISNVKKTLLRGNDSDKNIIYDADASLYDPVKNGDFLLLGHRRLSIIDLSSKGHQPMTDRKRGFAITFNGEIYNYIEIRNELVALGYTFETETDTEVILRSYDHWGEKCVDHFNGMWGFAIWDEHRHRLFCSRDRLGAKPFYYTINDGEFIFSSEIKQICQNPNVTRLLNEQVMIDQIMWNITDYSEETLIKDIRSLQGGYNLILELNETCNTIENIKIYRYWDIDTHNKDAEAEERAFDVLKDAIRLRTRSDAPIGVLLSGGIDSSCIVAEISEYYEEQGNARSNLNTFTSCYMDYDEGNEQKYAAMVNSHCGVKQNFIFPDPQNTLDVFEDLVWHLEGDTAFQVIGSYGLLQHIAQTGIKVLINGQGSDETQFGYERYYAWYLKDLLKNLKIRNFMTAFRESRDNSNLSLKMLAEYYLYFNSWNIRKTRCRKRMGRYVNKYVLEKFEDGQNVLKYIKHKNMQDLQYQELRGIQLTHILRMDDRLYMANSLESRVPYIDYRYVEESVRIPDDRKIQKGYTKYLLRKQYVGKLPADVIWRKNKMGWPSPRDRWAARFDDNKMEELFNTARSGKYFNIDVLRKLYYKDPSSRAIEKFLIIEFFIRRFNVAIP